MSLLNRIGGALSGVITGAGALWHKSLEPWFEGFLSTVSHAEVAALQPIAVNVVSNLTEQFIASKGDLSKFGDVAASALFEAGIQAKAAGIEAAGTSLLTAVAAAVANHPALQAQPQTPAKNQDPEGNGPLVGDTKTTSAASP